MSLTLAEAAKYTNNVLQAGVIEKFIYEDPILERIKWKEVLGNGLTYNTETTETSAQWYNPNEEWITPDPGTVTPKTANLKILGGVVDLDDFVRRTRGNVADLRAELMQQKVKAVKKEFMENFYYGVESSNARQFDGIQTLIADSTYNTIGPGAAGALDTNDSQDHALTCLAMDTAIDLVKGGKPDMILTSKALRRYVNKFLRGAGTLAISRDEFGRPVQVYGDGIPWYVSDYIRDTELTSSGIYSAKTGGTTTTMWFPRFADEAIAGIHVAPMEVVDWELLPNSNVERARIRWYCSIMFQNIRTCAKIVGIDVDGTVAV
jgi:hypothetical protein